LLQVQNLTQQEGLPRSMCESCVKMVQALRLIGNGTKSNMNRT
jgi:hypothetical protein